MQHVTYKIKWKFGELSFKMVNYLSNPSVISNEELYVLSLHVFLNEYSRIVFVFPVILLAIINLFSLIYCLPEKLKNFLIFMNTCCYSKCFPQLSKFTYDIWTTDISTLCKFWVYYTSLKMQILTCFSIYVLWNKFRCQLYENHGEIIASVPNKHCNFRHYKR